MWTVEQFSAVLNITHVVFTRSVHYVASVLGLIWSILIIIKNFIFAEELKRVSLEDSPEEINVIAFDENERKYPMEPNDEFDSDVLREFVEDFQKGRIVEFS